MSCGVGHRHSLDSALLWLWCRLAAVAPIQPLAWEPPNASGVALSRQKTKEKKKKDTEDSDNLSFPRQCLLEKQKLSSNLPTFLKQSSFIFWGEQ